MQEEQKPGYLLCSLTILQQQGWETALKQTEETSLLINMPSASLPRSALLQAQAVTLCILNSSEVFVNVSLSGG